jgi:hypothetical protein
MKKLILSAVLMAFAVAAQAGDAKNDSKSCGSDCCSKATMQTKASTCPYAKTGCKGTAGKTALMSPKAKSLV